MLIDFLVLTGYSSFRRTVVACLHNIVRLDTEMGPVVASRLPFHIFEGLLKDPDNRLLQSSLTLLMLLVKDGHYAISKDLMLDISKFTSSSSVTVKSKSLLAIGLSIRRNIDALGSIDKKVWVNIEKLRKDNYNYIHQSLKYLKDCLIEALYTCIGKVLFLDEACAMFPLIKDLVDWDLLSELLTESVPSQEYSCLLYTSDAADE